ncbi:unnamed protein product [Urochloa decumbens]|uniref:DUF4220 domain-containing protein n=1 Tax=Urochloa decumbens TaxID=240449 RepID=A0ABC9AJI4_9POAL
MWEIHCLILVSLFLQVFLFFMAGMRKRSTSTVLRTLLWLAYLSADTVAIFVLGHLAVHASEPRHQLMSFWAPFVLVHLGGQDTMSAFSKQDNELWTRHLLSLVTQVATAGYVVAVASWSDGRLRAAMVLVFLSGLFKYGERTLCLYRASPATLRSDALHSLSGTLEIQQHIQSNTSNPFDNIMATQYIVGLLRRMLEGNSIGLGRAFRWETAGSMNKASPIGLAIKDIGSAFDIMSVDAPINRAEAIIIVEDLPGILEEFLKVPDRYRAYEYMGAILVHCYELIYTKIPLRDCLCRFYSEIFFHFGPSLCSFCFATCQFSPTLLYFLFQYASIPIALVLFMAAEKGDHFHAASRADVTVSYILLIGAIILDMSSAIKLIASKIKFHLPAIILRVANCIRPPWSRKQWSEELGQYSIIKRHAVQETSGLASIRQWFGKRLGTWGVDLLELTSTPIAEDDTPIKEFILDSLLLSGIRKEWNIASSRGQLALRKWMARHQAIRPESSSRPTNALVRSINSSVDFSTSVLIWHIATEICYYLGDNASTSSDHDQMMMCKEMSRKLSNYIMYLVFKCGVMLTSNSQLLHDKVHEEIKDCQQGNPGERDVVNNLFKAKTEKEQEDSTAIDIPNNLRELNEEQHDMTMLEIKKAEELAGNDNADDNHLQKLLQSSQNLYSPLLPRAREVAQELISLNDELERWSLIAMVWSEMLYYTAPRCGGAFHYEHLSSGGEFITHVLLLMFHLGPFLPPPRA